MNAGRPLDRLVAEKVVGDAAMWGFQCPLCGSTHFGTDLSTGLRHCHGDNGCSWRGPPSKAPPAFSTDIAAAWQVVERFRLWVIPDERQWCAGIPRNLSGSIYSADMYGPDDLGVIDGRLELARADTAPLAICLAALKLVGSEALT